MADKPAMSLTDLKRVAGFAVLQEARDSDDIKMLPAINALLFEAFAVRHAKEKYVEIVRSDVASVLTELHAQHELIYSERPEEPGDVQDDWDEKLDDAVYEKFHEIGRFTLDFREGRASANTNVHDEEARNNLALAAGADAWKLATYHPDKDLAREMTPREILDELDITRAIVDAYVGTHTPPTVEQKKAKEMSTRAQMLTKLHYAKPLYDGEDADYDYDLEQATDSDDILASGSLEKIGLAAEDKQTLIDWLAELSYDFEGARDAINDTVHAVSPIERPAVETEAAAEPEDDEEAELRALIGDVPAAAPAPAPAKRQSKKAAAAAANEDPNVVPGPLLARLKDTLGEKDEVLATGCGMSRATFNNYVKGKGTFVASDTQFNFLRDMAIKRRDDLNAVIAEMGER